MSSPEDLRQITENTLHSLIADDSLKYRILQKAASSEQTDRLRRKKLIPVFCTVLAALLIAAVSLNSLQSVPSSGPSELNSFTAGKTDNVSSVFPEDFNPDSVLSLEIERLGTIVDADQCSALSLLLLNQSVPADTADPVAGDRLIVTTSNGNTYVFMTENPYLISTDHQCWSCPAFFREFSSLIK